jgi:hypothetical protein
VRCLSAPSCCFSDPCKSAALHTERDLVGTGKETGAYKKETGAYKVSLCCFSDECMSAALYRPSLQAEVHN